MRRSQRANEGVVQRLGHRGGGRWRAVGVGAAAAASLAGGCASEVLVMAPPSQYAMPSARSEATQTKSAPPFIYSARAGVPLDRHGQTAHEGVIVVFSAPVDAASLHPDAFVLTTEAGRRLFPRDATLAPATELDEHRTVMLTGIERLPDDPLVNVVVAGTLYDVHGRSLQDLHATVRAANEPLRPLVSEILTPAEARCAEQSQVARLYFNLPVHDVEHDDLAGIVVRLTDGSELTPVRFDDDEQGPYADNVLDLCLRSTAPILRIDIAGGLFEDAAERPNAATRIERFEEERSRPDPEEPVSSSRF